MTKVDVLVVGAGPAGCCAAAAAARAGADVLLIDRRRFPRPKTCGDGVLETCLPPLVELGLEDSVRLAPGGSMAGVRFRLADGSERSIDFQTRSGRPFLRIIRRDILDARLFGTVRTLARVRVEEGVNVESLIVDQHGTVTGLRTGDAVPVVHEAAVTVDAAGAQSSLARVRGVSSKPAAVLATRAYFEGVEGLTERVEFCFHPEVPAGYFWIFPAESGCANVGVALYRGGTSLRRAREVFLASAVLAGRFRHARRLSAWQGAGIPVQRTLDSRVRPGLILCGDAGSLCDPLTFHGLGPAIRSGRHAGHVASRAAARGDVSEGSLREYDRLWQEDFGARQQMIASMLVGLGQESTGDVPSGARFETLFQAIAG